MTSARDDSRRVAAELAEQRHAWWEALVRLASALVLVLDESGELLFVNDSVRSVLGYEPDGLLGTNAFDLVHPNDLVDVLADFAERLDRGGPNYLTHFRARTADGGWRHLAAYGADLREEPGDGAMIIHARDVTPEVESDEALRRSEERFRTLVQHSSDYIVLVDVEGNIRYASPALERVLGISQRTTPDAESILDLTHPDDTAAARDALSSWMQSDEVPTPPIEVRVRGNDGSWRVLEVVGRNLTADAAVGGVVVNARDVTERHRTRLLLEAQAALLEGVARQVPLEETLTEVGRVVEQHAPDVVAVVGLLAPGSGVRLVAAPSLSADLLVEARNRMVGSRTPLGLALRGGGELVYREVRADPNWADVLPLLGPLADGSCWVYPIVAPDDDSQIGFLALLSARPGDPSPDVASVARWAVHVAAVAVERQRAEDQLRHQALHDHLTGLPNRTLLLDRIEQALARAQRHDTDVAVLFVDLDQFKVINDSMGHARGDELLAQVAQRLLAALPADDTLGRFGGDEFVVVGEDVDGDLGAVALAERITDALTEPFLLGEEEITVSGSVGIVLADGDTPDPSALIRNADAAMYRAKGQGRGTHAMFEQALHDRLVERMFLERDLRLAVQRDELELHYQPVVRVSDGAVVGAEALLRWNRPGNGLVGPGDFIPVAEETGLIVPIGRWVLGEVCRQASAWAADPVLGELRLSANLSARQLADPHIVDVVRDSLADCGLEPERLILEVTESAVVEDLAAAHESLTHLHLLGVGISIDDFGTGWASMDYVRRFTVADELKIDRSFVADLELGTRADEAIVSASIVLATSLGLDVVAEGVETERQFAALRRLGCGRAQGYLFSRPVPVAAFPDLVRSFGEPSEVAP